MSNIYNCTFNQWRNHFYTLESWGFDLQDLQYICELCLERINDRQELTGEMMFNVTMADLGFGALASVLFVNDRLGGDWYGIPIPRRLHFDDHEVPNPYDDVEVAADSPFEDVEWEDVDSLMVHVTDVKYTGMLRSHRIRVVPVWV